MGLFRPPPSWPPPMPQATPAPAGIPVPRTLLLFLLLLVAVFLSPLRGILDTPRGWLAVLLACAVVDFLKKHPQRGHALVEYATVGALVFAVVTALAVAPAPPKAKPPAATRRPRVEQAQPDPLAKLRTWWQSARANAPVVQFPADPKEGR